MPRPCSARPAFSKLELCLVIGMMMLVVGVVGVAIVHVREKEGKARSMNNLRKLGEPNRQGNTPLALGLRRGLAGLPR